MQALLRSLYKRAEQGVCYLYPQKLDAAHHFHCVVGDEKLHVTVLAPPKVKDSPLLGFFDIQSQVVCAGSVGSLPLCRPGCCHLE